jgi:hypothetical protein
MRAPVIGAGILLGVAATALSAPAAFAQPVEDHPAESPEIHIIADGSPQAGESIEVAVRCAGDIGLPTSPVLQIGELHEVDAPADLPTFVAPATIEPDTEPGDHQLTSSCDGEPLSWSFTVYPADSGHLTGPEYPVAGDAIGIVVHCFDRVGRPQSPVVTVGELQRVEPENGAPTYATTGTVHNGTAPGGYPLSFSCDGRTIDIGLTVYAAGAGADGKSQPEAGGQVTRRPIGAPETGAATAIGDDLSGGRAGVVFGAMALGGAIGVGIGTLAVRRKAQR